MKPFGEKRAIIVFLLFCIHFRTVCGQDYRVPDVTIEALSPKGIRGWIPYDSKITFFIFHANINKEISLGKRGEISGDINKPTNDKWLYENLNIQLNVGDTIYYYIYVIINRNSYQRHNSYTIRALVGPSTSPVLQKINTPSQTNSLDASRASKANCLPTTTLVRNGRACAGQILFEDNFDSLREDLWQIEQYIPDEPDYPFVSYQRPPNAPTVSVREGYLYIQPILQQDLPGFSNSSIYSGTLDLFSGCTATSTKCVINAWGASILPPIASGRLTSKSFSFTYGVVEVRAKLPQGDWLYPDILLESLLKKYGALNYASGVLRIAGARGNRQLSAVNSEVGNMLLYGGPILDIGCRNNLISQKHLNKPWSEDFHVYTAKWEPDRITLSVDGEEWAKIEPAVNGLQGRFASTCNLPRSFLLRGSKMAPFDDHFFITLGLSAGGITEFNDDVTSAGRPKPWRNSGRKATLHFWQEMSSWYSRWVQPTLIIDYVKVRAL